MTQEQAQKFWPLYNEFSARRRELNRSGRLLRRDVTDGMTDQQIRENFNQAFAMLQQELNLEKDLVTSDALPVTEVVEAEVEA